MAKIKYYVSQSTGERHLISGMDSNYLYNARNKLKRTVYTNITKNGELEVSKHGKDTELYQALDNELQKRNSIDYLPPIIKYKRSNA